MSIAMNEITLDKKLTPQDISPVLKEAGYKPFSLAMKVIYVLVGKPEVCPPDFVKKGEAYGKVSITYEDDKTNIFISTETPSDIEFICSSMQRFGAKKRYN